MEGIWIGVIPLLLLPIGSSIDGSEWLTQDGQPWLTQDNQEWETQ